MGYHDEHDYTQCAYNQYGTWVCPDTGEYGIDVALPAGTPVYAPEPGTVAAYQPCPPGGYCWYPGRLLLRLDRGGVIGFGHVNDLTPPGTHVNGGQQIATIGDEGSNSHTEFMYSPSNTANYTRSDFTAYPLSDPRSPWSLLVAYMTQPPPYAYSLLSERALSTAGSPLPDPSHSWLGETGTLQLTVQNTGSITWGSNGVPIRIGTSQPNDHASILATAGWLSSARPTQLPPGTTVPPGGTFTFSFPFQIGTTSAKSVVEHFNLVAEFVTWLPDQNSTFGFTISNQVDRSVALRHTGPGGYASGPDGTITAFGGAPPMAQIGPNGTVPWPGWDIARGIVLRPDDQGGYLLDGWGGIHPFGNAPPVPQLGANGADPWPGWDIARGIALRSDGLGGYVLDGWGGIHAFGSAPPVPPLGANGTDPWPGWDIARGIVTVNGGSGGYVMDGWGVLHQFGTARVISGPYWYGWDVAKAIAVAPNDTIGVLVDGAGGSHSLT